MSQTKRILITGSRGFMGSALLKLLRRQQQQTEIFTLDRIKSRRQERHCGVDLTDAASVGQAIDRIHPHYVFHLAGADKTASWEQLWRVNVIGTINLLDALRRLKGKVRPRVIVAGTSQEYGLLTKRGPITERTPTAPLTPYGCSKSVSTSTALSYAGPRLQVIVARIFNVLGPELPEHHVAPAFCRQIARIEQGSAKRLRVRGSLTAARDFVDVQDVVSALWALARSGKNSHIYNVSSGRSVPIANLLRDLISMATVKIPVSIRKQRSGSHENLPQRGSNTKLRSSTDWRPRIKLHESLGLMLERARTR